VTSAVLVGRGVSPSPPSRTVTASHERYGDGRVGRLATRDTHQLEPVLVEVADDACGERLSLVELNETDLDIDVRHVLGQCTGGTCQNFEFVTLNIDL
jgi:hypothetical protein